MKQIALHADTGYRYASASNILSLKDICHVVGAIIHDEQNRQAYGGLFIEPENDGAGRMIKRALSKFCKPDDWMVYVIGGSYDGDDDTGMKEYTRSCRQDIIDMLKDSGVSDSRMYVRWTSPECSSSLRLNLATSQNELKVVHNDFITRPTVLYNGDMRNAPKKKRV